MLTDREILALKPREKSYRAADGNALFLEVTPTGSKLWRLRYRYGGKEKLMALGKYPETKGAAARKRCGEARELLQSGKDPGAERKHEKEQQRLGAANTFEAVARQWHTKVKPQLSETTSERHATFLQQDVYPVIGQRPIAELKASDMLRVLRRIEERGAFDSAKRVFNICGRVFRYGVANGYCDRDPTRDLEIKDILHPPPTRHHPAIVDPDGIGQLMRAIDGYSGTLGVASALKLSALLFVRPGELRHAEWVEMDLDDALWSIPAKKTKMRTPLLVPLCPEAVAILRKLHPLTGRSNYVFPSEQTKNRPMSENTINAALRRLGYSGDGMCAHGFRAMARTALDEQLKFRPDWIEAQLGHSVRDANGRAYNRTSFLLERREMMNKWADYLDELKRQTP